MTALSCTTIPNRKPFVREPTFVDGIGPPPFRFFDETQDHLGALHHAAAGWAWSAAYEDFVTPVTSLNQLGDFLVTRNAGLAITLTPETSPGPFEMGVWRGLTSAVPVSFEMRTAYCLLTGDFIYSAKVQIINRSRLDIRSQGGVFIGTGARDAVTPCPAFVGGGDSQNWGIFYAPGSVEEGFSTSSVADTGIPLLDGEWYVLQISRFAGAVRWHINGMPCRLNGLPGHYYPVPIPAQRVFEINRFNPGPLNDGFKIDYFHRMGER